MQKNQRANMQTLEQLATLTGSTFNGDKDTPIHAVASLTDAASGEITFVSNAQYINHLETTKASAVILSKKLADNFSGNALINEDPYLTFARVLEILHTEPKPEASIHQSASIAENVTLDETVNIGPNVVIEEDVTIEANVTINAGCFIGKNTLIQSGSKISPNVTLYKDTEIGKNCILHSGVVIGADGFGFAPTPEKEWYKIIQIGNVIVDDDVEIGANTTIDRAALGSTKILKGCKLDNQIHIGHNVVIDENTVMAAGTVVGGSSNIGKRCQIGGAVAISGHLNIADDVIITGKSMVIKSIKNAGVYSSGVAADENKKWRKNAARFRNLDDIAKKVSDLDKKLSEK